MIKTNTELFKLIKYLTEKSHKEGYFHNYTKVDVQDISTAYMRDNFEGYLEVITDVYYDLGVQYVNSLMSSDQCARVEAKDRLAEKLWPYIKKQIIDCEHIIFHNRADESEEYYEARVNQADINMSGAYHEAA